MAKTVFVDGNPALGVPGTIVTAEFLNAVNTHRHMGSANDGDGAIDYAAAGGSANALTVNLTPALTGHVTGMPVHFKAAATNTGAASLNLNGMGAVPLRGCDGQELSFGAIRAGGHYTAVYSGSVYILTNPSEPVGSLRLELSAGLSGVVPQRGYIKLNGALLSRASYPDLWGWANDRSLVTTEVSWSAGYWGLFSSGDGATTFRLPDYRGEFMRGFDDGRGLDSGRYGGQWQDQEFQAHAHSVTNWATVNLTPGGGANNVASGATTTGSTGGAETRPRNLPVLVSIKY